ncbi:MAG: sugar transferase [Spirochaetia bacterium]
MNKVRKFIIIFTYNIIFVWAAYFTVYRMFSPRFLENFTERTFVLAMLAVFSILYIVLMWKDLYSHEYHYYLKSTFPIVVKNLLISIAVIIAFATLTALLTMRGQDIYTLLFFVAVGVIAFFLLHGLQYFWIRSLSKLGFFRKRTLIMGTPDERFPIATLFQDMGDTKTLLGRVVPEQTGWSYIDTDKNRKYHAKLEEIAYKNHIGEMVIFMGLDLCPEKLETVASFCRENRIGYYLVPDIQGLPKRGIWKQAFSYIPIIERYSTERDSLTNISIKRLFDIFFATGVLLFFLPIGIFLAIAIKLEDGGPIFYVSKRVGKDGRPMRFYKFRSMCIDAEAKKKELMKHNERKDGPLFKMKNDPRITKVGRILRKYSLDEFPQFINVLRGDMSIVGPRPHLPSEVAHYSRKDYLRLECIPGITCFPQINGRDTLTFREWVDLDLEYRKQWNLLLDISVIKKTVGVVLEPILRKDTDTGVY